MTQEPTTPAPETAAESPAVDAALEASGSEPAASVDSIGLATDGAYYLIVGQFSDAATAQAVYGQIEEIERATSLRVDAVVMASADAEGKIHLGQVTEHSTKTGLKWGVVGGAVLGVIFPPSILASAVGFGVVGSVLGKVRNLSHRSKLSDELAGVIAPNTTGLIVFAQDDAVVEIEKALADADRIVSKAVDKQLALEIDREAAAAKEAAGV
jgi:uncharacterized membrane protein